MSLYDVNAPIAYVPSWIAFLSHKSNFAPSWELKHFINHKETGRLEIFLKINKQGGSNNSGEGGKFPEN